MSDEQPLNWRVEAACRAAWPGLAEVEQDGWLLRATGGTTRRSNSANPLSAQASTDIALIEAVEAFYAKRGLPAYFRVPDIADAIDPLLAARGYEAEGRTHTLFAPLSDLTLVEGEGATIAAEASVEWLEARDLISGSAYAAAITARKIMAKISQPCAYVSIQRERRVVALLLGVCTDGIVIPEAVMTHPDWRGQGLAGTCLSALARWAGAQGCEAMALQVEAGNAAALSAYRRMGFARELYSYHYRVKR